MQLTPALGQWAANRTQGMSPRRNDKRLQMLRIYFNFAWQLFFRPLKRLQPEYTPATSKGKQAPTAFLPAKHLKTGALP